MIKGMLGNVASTVAASREPIVFHAIMIGVFVLPSPRVMAGHDMLIGMTPPTITYMN